MLAKRPTRGEQTDFLVIGAGPFGLAMAAQLQELGIEHQVLGRPMSFWREHMPKGMLLRSGCQWHLDPMDRDTIQRFAETRGQTREDVEPLTLEFYLDYAQWFQETKGIDVRPNRVDRLDHHEGVFQATLDDGAVVAAQRVLLALGFVSFAHVPPELATLVPAEHRSHTCDLADPARFADRRVLIVGGRQSAFESAALLAEAGAAAVAVCHRHETPEFVESDWDWVDSLLQRIVEEPGWYRGLSEKERQKLNYRFWSEGRLKLEPWLEPRIRNERITIRPRTTVLDCQPDDGGLRIRLSSGDEVEVDHVLFATGYRVDMQRVPLLKAGNLLPRIECREGYPVLDESFQTTVPGLYVTSLPATRDFGLFFAFTSAVRASARILARSLA